MVMRVWKGRKLKKVNSWKKKQRILEVEKDRIEQNRTEHTREEQKDS